MAVDGRRAATYPGLDRPVPRTSALLLRDLDRIVRSDGARLLHWNDEGQEAVANVLGPALLGYL